MFNCVIDFGNHNVKFIMDGVLQMIFESGYERSRHSFGRPDEMIRKGEYMVFGKRMKIEQDKTESQRMMNCTLYCIAKGLEKAGENPNKLHHISLATTLPIDLYGTDQRDKYIRYYLGAEETVFLNGVEWRIVFDAVKVYPQGVVAWAAKQHEFERYALLVILDMGGRTNDVAVVAYDRFSGEMKITARFSLQNGVLKLINIIDNELQNYGIQIPEKSIEAVVYGDNLEHCQKEVILENVNVCADTYIGEVLNDLYEHHVDLNLPYCLVGGGSDMMFSRLEARLNVVANLGVMANAEAALETMKAEMETA